MGLRSILRRLRCLRRRILSAISLLSLSLVCLASDKAEIRFEQGKFVVRGWDEARTSSPEQWKEKFAVFVDEGTASTVAMLGTFRLDGEDLVFEPRFPLQEGLRYRAVLKTNPPVQFSVEIPHKQSRPVTRVQRVFPTSDRLPENQLKLYIHFSGPMSRGEAYRCISLLRDGKKVELPFLELEQELWDRSGTRLTILFDPGRIKRGLVPHNEVGPALEAGGKYVLVIDPSWMDATGSHLVEVYRKEFEAVAADRNPPDPAKWSLSSPPQASRESLKLIFPEPLDHALLERMLDVRGADGAPVKGTVSIEENETLWRFTPETPWQRGAYLLSIDTALEDLAGNRIGRPFDVDLFDPISRRVEWKEQILQFQVR